MSDREKLVELLYGLSIDTKEDAEYVADHLIANGVTVQNWRDAKTDPPKSGEHVLLCCEVRQPDRSYIKRYVCDGFYAAKHTETVFCGRDDINDIACEYSEENDEFYLLEGWYEVIKNWGDYNSIAVSDFVVGWMHLPEPLKEK